MLEVGIEKYFRDAPIVPPHGRHVDIHRFKIAKALFPGTAGTYAADGAVPPEAAPVS